LDGRKRVQKLFKAVAAFQIVNQISEGDARPDEHWDAAKNVRVAVDDGCDGGHPNLLPSFYSERRRPLDGYEGDYATWEESLRTGVVRSVASELALAEKDRRYGSV